MATPLSDDQIQEALQRLTGWSLCGDALQREFEFESFREAIAFIMRIAFAAEEANHHPELWNVYGRVRIRLNTHDAGGRVTRKDVNLAAEINTVSGAS